VGIEKYENLGIIAAVGVGIYLLYKTGFFKGIDELGKGFSWLDSGDAGAALSNTVVKKNVVAAGGSDITLGSVAVTSNPLTFIPNLVDVLEGGTGGQPSLNLTKTDSAYAKVGMTTAKVEKLAGQIGWTAYLALQGRIINGTLTDKDKTLLYSAGWDGTGGTSGTNAEMSYIAAHGGTI
jgi:hypothetical protein